VTNVDNVGHPSIGIYRLADPGRAGLIPALAATACVVSRAKVRGIRRQYGRPASFSEAVSWSRCRKGGVTVDPRVTEIADATVRRQ
jgi:hypothetical protein